MAIRVSGQGQHEPEAAKPRQREPSKGLRRRAAALYVSLALGGILAAGGMGAYYTSAELADNVFTVGEVKIMASEPAFPTRDTSEGRVDGVPDECEMLIPYETIPKDPRIQNTGYNDCIVFFRVTAPVETLNLINDDKTRTENVQEDLFWFKLDGDSDSTHKNHFNPKWVELASVDGQIVDCPGVNDEGKGKTYIFGYHKKIVPSEWTETLFDKVQNKKYGSRTIKANEVEQIKIESFAIQASEIHRAGKEINTDGSLNETDLTYIYKAFVNQNEAAVGKGAW